MEFHELANIFPMFSPDEMRQLRSGMRENGYYSDEPIILLDGKILDGRNRYTAALAEGIEPVYTNYNGDNPLAYVIDHNLRRRHLDTSQRGVIAARLANMTRGNPTGNNQWKTANLHNSTGEISQSAAAAMLNVSERTVANVKEVEKDAPELIPLIESGKITIHDAQKKVKAQKKQEARAEIAQIGARTPELDKWHVYHGDIATWQAPRQYDFIITDPPYPREYLPLWDTLARRACEWLKSGGLLIAMSGQSYLDEIYAMLSKHLEYYWTAAYLTPGQPTPLRQVNVNSTWKPLLIYSNGKYTGKIFGDVFISDGNDKDFHKWGQSIGGMSDIVSKICLPGQYILDPFCGAGTTGIAAIEHGCFFDGIDLLQENVNISKGRLHDATTRR